jgi:hypothetical protein
MQLPQKTSPHIKYSTSTVPMIMPDNLKIATLFPLAAMRPSRPAEPLRLVLMEEKVSDYIKHQQLSRLRSPFSWANSNSQPAVAAPLRSLQRAGPQGHPLESGEAEKGRPTVLSITSCDLALSYISTVTPLSAVTFADSSESLLLFWRSRS